MDKNKGIVFGFFSGIALCVLFYSAFARHDSSLMVSPFALIMHTILTPLLLAAVAIFVIAKIMDYLKLKATVSEDKGIEPDELRERLAQVERQLTDVQEVVLAIDEKLERQEQREQG